VTAAAEQQDAACAPSLCCVVLTLGNRPDELAAAVGSVQRQHGDPIDVLVVGNGGDVPPVPAPARVLRLAENAGIPGGRNAGVLHTTADVVIFLDDDGRLPDPTLADQLRAAFSADDRLGVVSFRILDPATGRTERRHVPRLRAGDPERSGDVTTFLGGACAVRRRVFQAVGLLPEEFFYGHEETDLAWRALDAGWRVRYDAGALMYHPGVAPTRHAQFFRLNARNRVWLARRNLPWPLAVAYLGVWAVLTAVRTRDAGQLRTWLAGLAEGWRCDPGPRGPIRWRTAWRMVRLGRPPVI
jgi:GT2 family glycosyltransferase